MRVADGPQTRLCFVGFGLFLLSIEQTLYELPHNPRNLARMSLLSHPSDLVQELLVADHLLQISSGYIPGTPAASPLQTADRDRRNPPSSPVLASTQIAPDGELRFGALLRIR